MRINCASVIVAMEEIQFLISILEKHSDYCYMKDYLHLPFGFITTRTHVQLKDLRNISLLWQRAQHIL